MSESINTYAEASRIVDLFDQILIQHDIWVPGWGGGDTLGLYGNTWEKLINNTETILKDLLSRHTPETEVYSDTSLSDSASAEPDSTQPCSEPPVLNVYQTRDDLLQQAEEADEYARNASVTETWYRGYSEGLRSAANSFNPEQVYRAVEHDYLRMDAARHLQLFFNIPENKQPADDETQDDLDGRYFDMCLTAAPFYGDINIRDNENRLLDDLIAAYEDQRNCNVAENDTWYQVVSQFVNNMRVHAATEEEQP